jgi:hypothetical protein
MKKRPMQYSKRYPDINLGFNFRRMYKLRCVDENLKTVKSEIKQGFLRMFRGYDDRAWWDMDYFIRKLFIRLLLELAENTHGYPVLTEWQDKSPDEQFELWQRYLVSMAGNFYRSLEDTVCNKTVNEYDEEYHRSFKTVHKKLPNGNYQMKFVPNDGYTKAEYQRLHDLYYAREREIDAYREKQLQIAFKKFIKVFNHLAD